MKSTKATPERTGTARSTFERLIGIAVEATTPQGVRTSQLTQRYEVSAKTIMRDLDFLRDRLMLAISYDPNGLCWRSQEREKVTAIQSLFANLR